MISQSQNRSSSETTCEEIKKVRSASAAEAITFRINSSLATGSRLETGSSSTSSGARLASAMVSETWARCPPDRLLILRCSGMPRASIRAAASL